MLHQDLENEDELLLALAGLKQVRDVLWNLRLCEKAL